jgi:hypothetical protein
MERALTSACYRSLEETKRPVQSVQDQLGGRNIFAVLQERAAKAALAAAPPPPKEVAPPVAEHHSIVTQEALSSVGVGDSRDFILMRLGEPSTRAALNAADGLQETFTYHLKDGRPAPVRLLNGKVTQVAQR